MDGQQKYIDVYLPETMVMIEQKGMTHDLTKPEPQSGDIMLTPYQQAKRYANNMPLDEMPRYIVTCNFQEFRIYDQNKPGQDPEVIRLEALQDAAYRMEFLVKKEHASLSEEMKISIPERTGYQNVGEASIKKRSDFEETVRKEEQALVKGVSPAVLAGYLQKISKREIGLLGRILHHI